MSTAEEFAQHLAFVTGDDVYTSKLPAKPVSADGQWSVVADAGTPPVGGNFLKWKQDVNLRVTYRHKSAKSVYDQTPALQEALDTFSPTESQPALSKVLTPMSDTDTDAEGRQTGSWQVTITIKLK